MADPIKFSDEEMQKLAGLQTSYREKMEKFGQVKVQRLLLTQQLSALESAEQQVEVEYKDVQESEKKLVDTLNKKYGQGTLDVETGIFTPNS
tara:strand:+ start:148 stop:423 length:276 start_codon:yes stop_codon:yes gene_type:complete